MQIYLSDNEGKVELVSGEHSGSLTSLVEASDRGLVESIELTESKYRILIVKEDKATKLDKCFSNIRHEISNPLNLIKMIVTLLQKGKTDEKKTQELLRDINRHIDRIIEIISTLSEVHNYERNEESKRDEFLNEIKEAIPVTENL